MYIHEYFAYGYPNNIVLNYVECKRDSVGFAIDALEIAEQMYALMLFGEIE